MDLMLASFADRKPAYKPLSYAGRQVHFLPIQGHPIRKNRICVFIHLLFHRKSTPRCIVISPASGFVFRFGMHFNQGGIYAYGLLDFKPSTLQLLTQLLVQPRLDRLNAVTKDHKGDIIVYFLIQGKAGVLMEVNPELQRFAPLTVA